MTGHACGILALLAASHLALVAAESPSGSSSATTSRASPAEPAGASATVRATQAWSRATTSDAQTGVVYLTLENHGEHRCPVHQAASTHACGHVAIHESACCAGGEMTMHEIATLTVPAHGQLVLKPGACHLMLMQLTHGLMQGEAIPLTLTVGGAAIAVTASVRAPGAMGPKD